MDPKLANLDYAKLEQIYSQPAGKDLHRQYAAELFGVAYDDVTPEQRRTAKTLAFWQVHDAK